MKKITLFSLLTSTLLSFTSTAQNIGINGTGGNAHPSALLDIDAVATPSLGVLIPRIALQAVNVAAPISSPATSLLLYNTATASSGTNAVSPGYYYWDGVQWVRFAYNGAGSFGNAWTTLGNAGTNASTNFLGTTDAQELAFRTNNLEAVRIGTAGNIGVGIAPTPTAFVFTQKSINSNFTPAGYYLQQNDLYNNSTFTSAGNAQASLNRLINNAAGNLKAAGSIIASQNDLINNGTVSNTQNAFGSYHDIINVGTFSVTNLASGLTSFIENQAGKNMYAQSYRGVQTYIANAGNLTGSSPIGISASVFNSSIINATGETSAGYFTVDNSASATMTSPVTRGLYSAVYQRGTLNGANLHGSSSEINLIAGSTTSLTNEMIATRNVIGIAASTTAKVNNAIGGSTYISNSGNLTTSNTVLGVQGYVANYGTILTPYLRGAALGLYNYSVLTTTQSIGSIADFINNSGNTHTTQTGIGLYSNMYNAGTINTPYLNSLQANNYNAAGGVMNTSSENGGSNITLTNLGSIPNVRYIYGTRTDLYNKGTIHSIYQRGTAISLVNDTAGVITNDTNYIALLTANANRGTLTAKEMRGIQSTVNNTPSSNTSVLKMVGIESYIYHDASSTIPDAFGIVSNVYKSALGNITNAYGLYIGAVQGTNKWSIFANDPAAPSYFRGNVGINTTTPTEKLEIQGSVKIVDGTQGAGKVLTSDAAGKAIWKNNGLQAPSFSVTWDASLITGGVAQVYPNAPQTFGPFTVPNTGWYTLSSRWFYEQNTLANPDIGAGIYWMQIDESSPNLMDSGLGLIYEIRSSTSSDAVCPPSGSFVYMKVGFNYYVHQSTKYCSSAYTGERTFRWNFVQ